MSVSPLAHFPKEEELHFFGRRFLECLRRFIPTATYSWPPPSSLSNGNLIFNRPNLIFHTLNELY